MPLERRQGSIAKVMHAGLEYLAEDSTMKRLIGLAVAVGAALGTLGAMEAGAMPVGSSTTLQRDDAEAGLALKAHGCHRYAQDSLEGWHRHVGPGCRWVPSERSYRNPYARCRTRCQYIGPIKQCYQDCR